MAVSLAGAFGGEARRGRAVDTGCTAAVFRLGEKWRLDTGKRELTERDLFDITRLVVGSEGDVYLLNSGSRGEMVFSVDKAGQLRKSFARQGRGPGELERPPEMFLTADGHIFVRDPVRWK